MFKKIVLLMLCSCLTAVVSVHAQSAADTTTPVFTYVEQMPQYPGGDAAMLKFINDNIKYPPAALKNGVAGRVYTKFIVDETGKISNIKVQRSSGDASLDEEAIRVLSLMPQWKPGKHNGTAVKTFYQLPLTFRMQDAQPVQK